MRQLGAVHMGKHKESGVSRRIVDALPEPLIVLDQTLSVIRVNTAAEDLFGVGRKRMVGAELSKFLNADNPLFSVLQTALNRATPIDAYDIPLRLLHAAHGAEIQVDARLAPISLTGGGYMAESGVPDGVLLQLSRIGKFLSSPGQEARQSATVFATLLHEIRNPLAGISGAAQLLEETVSEADQALVSLIREETARIISLTQKMWAFGDLAPPRREAVNIHILIDRALSVLSLGEDHSNEQENVSVISDYDPSLPDSYVDRDQIVQALMNVLRNAYEALPRSCREIRIKTSWISDSLSTENNPRLQIDIIDNGHGLAPEIKEHLFEPFQTTKPNGHGIGLALSAQIVEANGGTLKVESRPGRTCFTLRLPQVRTHQVRTQGLSKGVAA